MHLYKIIVALLKHIVLVMYMHTTMTVVGWGGAETQGYGKMYMHTTMTVVGRGRDPGLRKDHKTLSLNIPDDI